MARQYITIEEANELLPSIRKSFIFLYQLHIHVKALMRELEQMGYAPRSDSFKVMIDDVDEDVLLARGQLRAVIDAMSDELTDLRALGCIVRDIEAGAVAWYCKHPVRGDILLSWKLGEITLGYWIEVGTGRVQRRPLHELDAIDEPEAPTETAMKNETKRS